MTGEPGRGRTSAGRQAPAIGRAVTPLLLAAALLIATLALASGTAGARDRSPAGGVAGASSTTQLPDVQITVDQVVAAGFSQPIQVTHAGDDSGRLFVVEQSGRIRVIRNQVVLPTPFLSVAGLITFGVNWEQGLLGLTFHPAYETNGLFYIYYTDLAGDSVLARYSESANPDRADPDSGLILLTVDQPFPTHNAGQIAFGPLDNYLYVALGDGGSAGDPYNNGQNNETLLGSLLRLDVDGGLPYAIPADNPFVGGPGRDEIWAFGLRNPWRFSFDRLTGDLYVGDVGQNRWEEIDFQAAGTPGGLNFGWRCREGAHSYSAAPPCNDPVWLAGLTDPIAEYHHSLGRSVTGGFVYRGGLYPALTGRYFFADYVDGQIWSLYQTGPGAWSAPELELDTPMHISSFGEDEAGELYVVDRTGGRILRLADASGPAPDLSASFKTASAPAADPGQTVSYTIVLVNTGRSLDAPVALTDTVPAGLAYQPGSLAASVGQVDDTAVPSLRWQGSLSPTARITVTYLVSVAGDPVGSLINHARVGGPDIAPITLSHALHVPGSPLTSTLADLFLPGTQPGALVDTVTSPTGCDFCHTGPIYDRWRGTMMSQAGRDPLLWSALAVANVDAPSAGDYCLRCHTPKGWLEGRSHPADGSALRGDDLEAGVGCAICHRMVDPIPSPDDQAVLIDAGIRTALTATVPISATGSGMTILDPQDRRRGPFELPIDFSYHSAYRTDYLGQSADPVTESRLCGTCHNVDNPLLSWDPGRGQYWPNAMGQPAPSVLPDQLFPIERTYSEWLYSAYPAGVYAPRFAGARPDGMVQSCQDCHQPRASGAAAEPGYDPVQRDCLTTGCLPEHDLVGGNTWLPELLQDSRWRLDGRADQVYLDQTLARAEAMLHRAATVTVTLVASGTDQVAVVRVVNQTGHKLPTGYPEGRRMWLNLRAYDENGALVYQSGAYNPATGRLLPHPDLKVYEVKQGITPELAALIGEPAGESFHFVLNNTVVKDNRIPPRGYTQAAYDRPGLRPVGTGYADGQYWDDTVYPLPASAVRVLVTLTYQTASREYIEFLRTEGGLDGATLGALWEGSKSPPVVIDRAWYPNWDQYLALVAR